MNIIENIKKLDLLHKVLLIVVLVSGIFVLTVFVVDICLILKLI